MGGAVAMVMVVGGTVVMVMFSDVTSLVIMDRSGRGRSLDPSVTHLNQLSLRKI